MGLDVVLAVLSLGADPCCTGPRPGQQEAAVWRRSGLSGYRATHRTLPRSVELQISPLSSGISPTKYTVKLPAQPARCCAGRSPWAGVGECEYPVSTL